MLAQLTFDDEETGFKGAGAKADGNTGVTIKDGAAYFNNKSFFKLVKEDGSSLLTGKKSFTISYKSKAEGGNGWTFFTAPDDSKPVLNNEKYLGIMDKADSVTVERYNNTGERKPKIMGNSTSDWKLVTVAFDEGKTTVYVNGEVKEEEGSLDSDVKIDEMLGDSSILQVGKAQWGEEYYKGYMDDLTIYDKVLTKDEIVMQNRAFFRTLVQKAKDALTIEGIEEEVEEDLVLPTTGINGSKVTWASGNEDIISKDGKVERPDEAAEVKLTATITLNGLKETKEFTVKVKAAGEKTEIKLPTENLVASYKFDAENVKDGVVKDLSGKDNNATIEGEGETYNEDGTLHLPGGAANSAAAYVEIPGSVFEKQDTLTISIWLKNETGAGNYAAMFFGTPTKSFGSGDANAPGRYWLLNPCNPDGNFKSVWTKGAVDAGAPWGTETKTSSQKTTANWALYTTVITPDSITGYLDGVEVCTAEKDTTTTSFGEGLVAAIGRSGYADPFYKGSVGEVTVYNTALTKKQILADAADRSLALAKAALDLGDLSNVKEDITLPEKGAYKTNITWTSDHEDIIAADGKVTRPTDKSTDVKLTATIEANTKTVTKEFTATVKAFNDKIQFEEAVEEFNFGATGTEDKLDLPKDLGYEGTSITWESEEDFSLSAKASTDHVSDWENVNGVNTDWEPTKSNDGGGKGWGNWQQAVGSEHYLQYDWDQAVTFNQFQIFWYDDGGGTQIPASLKVQYLAEDGKTWKDATVHTELKDAIAVDKYNTIKLDPVTTKAVKLVMTVKEGAAANGVYRWKVQNSEPVIEADGTVNRPAKGEPDTKVNLTAKFAFEKGDVKYTAEKVFPIIVRSETYGILAAYTRSDEKTNGVNLGASLHLAYSADGRKFTALNSNTGICFAENLGGSKNSNPNEISSASIFRKADGTYGLVARSGNAKKLYVWDSKNLINFTDERAISVKVGVAAGPFCRYNAESGLYEIIWTGTDKKNYMTTTADLVAAEETAETAEALPVAAVSKDASLPDGAVVSGIMEVSKNEYDAVVDKFDVVKNVAIGNVEDIEVDNAAEIAGKLQESVKATYSDGSEKDVKIDWNLDTIDMSQAGTYEVVGTLKQTKYANPFIEQRADPCILKGNDGYYYFTASYPMIGSGDKDGYDKVVLRRAKTLDGLKDAEEITIFDCDDVAGENRYVWAPEIRLVDDNYYVFYTSSIDNSVWSIRPHVLKCTDAANIMDPKSWTPLGVMQAVKGDGKAFTGFSLDMTVFENNGRWYVVWAQKDGVVSSLWIAEIDPQNPNKCLSAATKISVPEFAWERIRENVNEGPSILKSKDGKKIFCAFSAAGTGPEYCVGLLSADADADLLKEESWVKQGYPVLSSADVPGEYGPGHNSFTVDEDGNDIFVYHARDEQTTNGDPLYDPGRDARVKRVHWAADGTPILKMSYDEELMKSYVTAKVVVKNSHEHEYGDPVFEWADDYSSATATMACACGNAKSAVALVTKKEEGATITYTATAVIDGTTYTDTKTATHDHVYGYVKFEWAADYSSAKAVAICACGDKKTVDAKVTSEKDGADTVYIAKATVDGKEYTDTKRKVHEHSYESQGFTWSADNNSATLKLKCSGCDDEVTVNAVVISKKEGTDTVYTATAIYEEKEYTDTKTVKHEHSYESQGFEWAADYKSAKLKVKCEGCQDAKTVDATVTSKVDGTKTVYTATATYEGETYTDTKTVENPKTDDSKKTDTSKGTSTAAAPAATGTVLKEASVSYKVTNASAAAPEVAYTNTADTKATKATVPATVKIGNVTYKVTSIEKNAFKNCKKLKSVTIKDNIKEIKDNAFKGCTSLKKVVIPKNVTKLGKNAFSGCKKLKTITIKSTALKTIGKKAFKGINKKATIKVPKKKKKAYKKLFKKAGLPSSVKIK